MQKEQIKKRVSKCAYALSMCAGLGLSLAAYTPKVHATELNNADTTTYDSQETDSAMQEENMTELVNSEVNSVSEEDGLGDIEATPDIIDLGNNISKTDTSDSENIGEEVVSAPNLSLYLDEIEARYQESDSEQKVTLILQYDKASKENILDNVRAISNAAIKYEYEEIFDGASIEVPAKELHKLRMMQGISFVEESQKITPQMVKTGEVVHTLRPHASYPHDGRGMVIAIIDSGIDTRHKDMRLDDGIIPKIPNITETVEKEYTLKIPHGYNYVGNNHKLIDETELPHGMHIAGILGANATDEEVANHSGIDGIAPNAQLLMYRVFSDRQDTQVAVIDDTVFAAMEDAIKHGADVISLSIGSYGTGKPGDAFYKAVERAKSKGIVVVASIGNGAGSSSTTSYDKYGNNAFDQKDVATTVSVAANLDVIGVGSTRNKYQINHKVQIAETEIFFTPVSYTDFKNGTYEFVHVGKATPDELKNIDLSGKVAIISRSSETAKIQFDRLRDKDAVGVISYNNNTGRNRDYFETEIERILDETVAKDLWGISVSHQDGMKLLELIKENNNLPVKKLGVKYNLVENNHEVSGFSSWGTTLDLELKPEIVAPGEFIYSTFNHNRYGIMSGTSMSTPVVAAAATILLPKFRQMNRPSDVNITDFIKIMMMNTADPVFDTTNLENSPRQQGAGILNITDAFDNNVLLTSQNKGAVTLKEIGDTVEFKVKLTNMHTDVERFNLRKSKILTSVNVPVVKDDGEIVKEIHSAELKHATLTSDVSSIELQPGESKEITFVLNTAGIADTFVEGYLYFDSDTNPSLAIPYFGYKGDWHNAAIIDPPAWDTNAKTKLTTLMSTYRDNSKTKYLPLGLEDVNNPASAVNPDRVAINSLAANGFTSSAFIRLGVMRDVLDYDIDIVTEPSSTARSLRIVNRGNILERFRYVDYFENDYFKNKFSNPNGDKFNWDGKLYDATTGSMLPATEGQYYVRIKVRNDKMKDYQYTYLPIKVDNTAPTVVVEKQDMQYTIKTADNNRVWFIKAKVDGQPFAVKKVNDNQYQLEGIHPETMHQLVLEVVDIAGNITKYEEELSTPLIQFMNLDEIKTKRRQKTLEAKVKDTVASVEATLQGKALPVTMKDQHVSIDLSSIQDGIYQLSYTLKNRTGNIIKTHNQEVIRDTHGPVVELDLEYKENDSEEDEEELEILKSENGYATIKGKATDTLTQSKNIKITHYLPKDKLKKERHKLVPVNEDGTFEFRAYLSDYPTMVNVDFTDESGNTVTRSLFTNVLEDEHIPVEPIIMSESFTNNFLKHENLEDNLELIKGENGEEDSYKYVIKFFADEEGYKVRINGGTLQEIDEVLSYSVILHHGANILNIEGYDFQDKLVYQRRLNYFVDVNAPTYEFNNLRIRPVEEGEENPDVIGTVYFAEEENILKGFAEDDGLEWALVINQDTVRRGKAWREFGQNRENFEYSLVVKDNDLLSLRLYDFHGNETNHRDEKYRIRMDKEKPTITADAKLFYKRSAKFDIKLQDNHGIAQTHYSLDGADFDPNSEISALGKHVLSIMTEDYAGNQTILEHPFTIIDDLLAEKMDQTIRFSEIKNIQTWLKLSEGTKAEVLDIMQEGTVFRITVRLFNDLGENIINEYQLPVLQESSVPSVAPTADDLLPYDLTLDNDQDGYTNGEELAGGSNPEDKNSVPAIPSLPDNSNETPTPLPQEEKQTTISNTAPITQTNSQEKLPSLDENQLSLIFSSSALAILAGLGLLVTAKLTAKRKEI